MPTTLQTAGYPATKTIAGPALPAAARAYRPTTGRTVGSIIAAIMATQAMRNAASDIVASVSTGMASPRMPAALTTASQTRHTQQQCRQPDPCPQSPVWLAVAHVTTPIGWYPGDDHCLDRPLPGWGGVC
jgi:hypothetical protein